MRTIKFVFAACIAIAISVLFVANGDDASIAFWPDLSDYGLPKSPEFTVSVAAVGLICGLLGFVLGAAREYLREGGLRRQARASRREAARLKSKVDELMAEHGEDNIPGLPSP